MCIRQPGMERKHRYLDCESKGKCQEKPDLCGQIKFEAEKLKQAKVGDAGLHPLEIQEDKSYQHQERADHCVYEEFNSSINFVFPTPNSDHEIHRNQHDFPENIEQKKIQRDKRT